MMYLTLLIHLKFTWTIKRNTSSSFHFLEPEKEMSIKQSHRHKYIDQLQARRKKTIKLPFI